MMCWPDLEVDCQRITSNRPPAPACPHPDAFQLLNYARIKLTSPSDLPVRKQFALFYWRSFRTIIPTQPLV